VIEVETRFREGVPEAVEVSSQITGSRTATNGYHNVFLRAKTVSALQRE
jgi:hypothetical protein